MSDQHKRALLIGGPADGEWRSYEPGQNAIFVNAPVGSTGPHIEPLDEKDRGDVPMVRVCYVRTDFKQDSDEFSIFVHHSITKEQALALLIDGYRHGPDVFSRTPAAIVRSKTIDSSRPGFPIYEIHSVHSLAGGVEMEAGDELFLNPKRARRG